MESKRSFKKKLAISLVSTSLVAGSFTAVAPLANVAYAAQLIEFEDKNEDYAKLVEKIRSYYNHLTAEEKQILSETRDFLERKDADWWIEKLALDEFASEAEKRGVTKKDALAFLQGLIQLTYGFDERFAEDLDRFRNEHRDTFNKLFRPQGTEFTLDDLFALLNDIQEQLISTDTLWELLGNKTVEEIIKEAVYASPKYSQFKGTLSQVGLSVDQLLGLKDKFNNEVVTEDGKTISDVRRILLSAAAREFVELTKPQSLKVGEERKLILKIVKTGTGLDGVDIAKEVNWSSNSNNVVTVIEKDDGIYVKGVSVGSATITAQRNIQGHNIVFASFDLEVKPSTSSGGGGGGPSGGVGQQPVTPAPSTGVTVPVTVTPGTTADGKTTLAVTVKESDLTNSAASKDEPVNVVLQVAETADVVNAQLPVSAITSLNSDNAANTITLDTPIGSTSVSAAELARALNAAAASGLDLSNAKVEIVIEKGSTEAQAALQSALGSGSEVLAGLISNKILVTAGDKTFEVKEYQNYVKSTLKLDGTFAASQIVGVEVREGEATAAKERSAVVAATTVSYAPVPTVIEKVDGKTVVHVKKKINAPFTVVKNNKRFDDVTTQWFAADVNLLANKLLVSGRSASRFEPQGTLTRAEFATLLVRALGLPQDKAAASSFADVKAGDWYSGYVGAASKAGIIHGYVEGNVKTFKPNAPVTRQEAARMLVTAIEIAGGKVSVTEEEKNQLLAAFADRAKVHDWAAESVAILVKEKILYGDNGNIKPLATATRAESAALLKRFLKHVNFITE